MWIIQASSPATAVVVFSSAVSDVGLYTGKIYYNIYRSNPLSILVFRYPRSIHSRLAEIVIKFLYFRCQAGSGHCVIDKVANLTQFSLEEIQNIASDVLKHFNRTRIQSQLSKSRYSGSTELQQIQSNCSLLNLVNFWHGWQCLLRLEPKQSK